MLYNFLLERTSTLILIFLISIILILSSINNIYAEAQIYENRVIGISFTHPDSWQLNETSQDGEKCKGKVSCIITFENNLDNNAIFTIFVQN